MSEAGSFLLGIDLLRGGLRIQQSAILAMNPVSQDQARACCGDAVLAAVRRLSMS